MLEKEDEFWDIEMILPPDRGVKYDTADTSSVEISFGQNTADTGAPIPERRLLAKSIIDTFEKKSPRLLSSYKPECALITNVSIYAWPVKYSFYEKFISDGEKTARFAVPSECERVPFFSYMPQYNQLSLKQLKFYIKWRDCFKRRVPIKADFSYILLYIYELLNLERLSTPEDRLCDLCDIWLTYRDEFPRLDKYLSEWVCDFCLIHKLPPPSKQLSPIINDIARVATLKEFYTSKQTSSALEVYISANSMYKYGISPVINEKNRHLFTSHVIPAAAYALRCANGTSIDKESAPSLVRISRDCYCGALCTGEVKCRIDIDCYRQNKDDKYKREITPLVKHCENGVRAHLGIKSRVSTVGLSDELRGYADEYFEKNLPPMRTQTEKRKLDEDRRYALYDTDNSDFTTEEALKIEESSWEITKELVPLQEEDEVFFRQETVQDQAEEAIPPYEALLNSLSDLHFLILKYILYGKRTQAEELCIKNGIFFEGATDEINEIASDITDDIIIEDSEITEDYKDLLRSAFEKAGDRNGRN